MMKNKGYTLVEMVIVVAIMGILAGLSFVSLGVINEARCSSAVNSLNNQISSCLIRTKAVSNLDEPLCMVIKKNSDGAYVIVTGRMNGSTAKYPDVNKEENCEAVLAKQISKITYTKAGESTPTSDDEMIIQFVKSDGSVQIGAGQYDLYTGQDGEEHYASIYVDQVSGKHYIK